MKYRASIVLMGAWALGLASPKSAAAYNYATHTRMAELAVRAMGITPPASTDPMFAQEGVPNVDVTLYQQFITEVAAAPGRLKLLRHGMTRLFASDTERFSLANLATCKVFPDDNLSNIDGFRITDFRYLPHRRPDPCPIDREDQFEDSPGSGTIDGVPDSERVLETVIGWHAANIDDHTEDTSLWFRPTRVAFIGWALDLASRAVELGFTAVLAPFFCAYDAVFGDGCDIDSLGEAADFSTHINPIEQAEGVIPGIGDISGGDYPTLWHFINAGRPGGEFNTPKGLYYPAAGPTGTLSSAIDLSIMAAADFFGLSLNQMKSAGTDEYGQFDRVRRDLPTWQAHTFAHVEFSPVSHLGKFGWELDWDRPSVSSLFGLGWPLHAIGDATEPHHVVGTSGYGHRPYENLVEHLAAQGEILTPDQQAETLKRIFVKGFFWWQMLQTNDGDVGTLIENLATQTRLKMLAEGDWAYLDGPSVDFALAGEPFGEVRYRIAVNLEPGQPNTGYMIDFFEDGAGASLALLAFASTKVQDPGQGDIKCPGGTHFDLTAESCVPGTVILIPPIDLSDAGVGVVVPPDAGADGAACLPAGAPCDVDHRCCGTLLCEGTPSPTCQIQVN